MLAVILFIVCLAASSIGAVAGYGGGVIIKPVVDTMNVMPASTISFLSGCTVLSMSVVSLLRSRGNGVILQLKTTVPLAVGAAGGCAGALLGSFISKRVNNRAVEKLLIVLMLFIIGLNIYNLFRYGMAVFNP